MKSEREQGTLGTLVLDNGAASCLVREDEIVPRKNYIQSGHGLPIVNVGWELQRETNFLH